jgi:hypothetical protein
MCAISKSGKALFRGTHDCLSLGGLGAKARQFFDGWDIVSVADLFKRCQDGRDEIRAPLPEKPAERRPMSLR